MELKTLKDIEYDEDSSKIDLDDFWVNSSVLRKEAIKWRKNIHILWNEWFEERYIKKTTRKVFGEWLLDRLFNITEGDLKDE